MAKLTHHPSQKRKKERKKHITPHTSSVFSIYLGSVPIAVVSVLSNSFLFFASDPCFGKIYLIWPQLVHSFPLFRSYPVIWFSPPCWVMLVLCEGEKHRQDKRHVRLVVNDCKFSARIIFFSHTKPTSSNNPRSYTIVLAPAEQAEGRQRNLY